MGQVLKGENTRFRGWFHEVTGIDYNKRLDESRRIHPLTEKLGTVTEYIRDDETEEHRGILSRITNMEISIFVHKGRLGFDEIPNLLDQWTQQQGRIRGEISK